jgi:Tol biopolymer transport system component
VVWFRESSLSPSAREIWIGNPDGSGATQLTSDAEQDNTPDISTNNQSVVWSTVRGSARNLWIMRANGTEKRQISTGGTDDLPRFSPDGTRIAFVSSRDGTPSVYVMDADGMNVRKLAGTEIFRMGVAGEVAPIWSKDGRLLYFNGRTGSGPEGIFVIPFNGSTLPVRLRNNTVSESIYDLR